MDKYPNRQLQMQLNSYSHNFIDWPHFYSFELKNTFEKLTDCLVVLTKLKP